MKRLTCGACGYIQYILISIVTQRTVFSFNHVSQLSLSVSVSAGSFPSQLHSLEESRRHQPRVSLPNSNTVTKNNLLLCLQNLWGIEINITPTFIATLYFSLHTAALCFLGPKAMTHIMATKLLQLTPSNSLITYPNIYFSSIFLSSPLSFFFIPSSFFLHSVFL